MMGDVFNAMNRAQRDKNPGADPTAASPPDNALASSGGEGGGGPEQPSLPLHQVQAAPIAQDSAPQAGATPAPLTPVATAVQRSQAETTERRQQQAASLAAAANPRLNGYAEQIVVHHDRGSLITEQYRAIRTQILARSRNRRLQTHVITSSAPEEGKTITCLNLGMTFAELRNQRTLLIEGDLRRPRFDTYFDRACKPGLLAYLRGEITEIDLIIHPSVYDNLQFIPAGGHDNSQSTELLSHPRMGQLLDRLKDRYDHIFIDTPPVISVTDPCILGAMCDETILCVRLNKTPSEVIDRAKRLLRAANCELAGAILTHLRPDLTRFIYRQAYYKYYTSVK